MICHTDLGNTAFERSRKLKQLIDAGKVRFGGNSKLKIYGLLSCGSGRRMKPENRVFFKSAEEAESDGYRACGNCMREKYKIWKSDYDTLLPADS